MLLLAFRWALAAQPSGTVVAWGMNLLSEGTTVPPADYYSTGAVLIAGHVLSNATAVAAGGLHALALRTDGTVLGWGGDVAGETVGSPSLSPQGASGEVKVGGQVLTNVVAIAAGSMTGQSFSLALRHDRTVVGWGDNRFGQTSVPAGLTNATAIAAGAFQGLALQSDGTVVSWGQGNPAPNWLSNVVAISAGGQYGWNLALKSDGTVAEWPVRSSVYSSAAPAGLSNVIAIATAGGPRLALKRDGTVVGWGSNEYGQATGVPNPVFPNQSTGTVMIAGQVLSNVVAIAAGFEYSLGLKRDGTVVAWGHPYSMKMTVPAGLTNVTAIAAGNNFCLAIITNAAPFGLKR